MSNHSEYTKSYIRFFADAEGYKTHADLLEHLNLSDRNVALSKRPIKHTLGDLVYAGILMTQKPAGHKYCRYLLTPTGHKIAAEFHTRMPKARQIAENLSHPIDKIIPKENYREVPSIPIVSSQAKRVWTSQPLEMRSELPSK